MTDMTASLVLSLRNSQFQREMRESGRAVERFAGRTEREMRQADRSVKRFATRARRDLQGVTGVLAGGLMGGLRNELVALGTAWAGLSLAKDSALLDKNLTRMSQTAGEARNKTQGLRRELFALQRQYGTLVEESRKGNDVLIQSGLNWAQALGGTKAIAPANAVTGASSEVLASGLTVGAKLFDFDLAQAGVATEMLDKMTAAGRLGNAELEDLSGIFARIGANAKSANLGFEGTLGFIEQLSLIEKQPERLATLADSTLRIFTNQKYRDKVSQGLGIPFYNADGSRRDAFGVIDDIAKLYRKQKTDQRRDKLIAYAFGETDLDTQKGIRTLLSGNNVDQMRELTARIGNSVGTIEKDLADAIDNGVDQTARLRGALREAADSFIQPITAGFSQLVKYGLDSKAKGGLGLDGQDLILGGAGMLAGGAAAYKYGGPMVKKLLGKGGRLAAGVASGKALEAAAGVTPVYVVNMPGGGMGNTVGDMVDSVRGGRRRSRLPRLPGPGARALPGNDLYSVWQSLAAPGGRAVLNDKLSTWGGRLLGGIGLSKGVLAGGALSGGWAGLGGIGLAGAAGYGAGSLLYKGALEGTDVADDIGRAVAKALAFFGNDSAQAALAAEQRAKLMIEVDDKRVRVKQVSSEGMDAEVAGSSMVMP